MKIPKKIIIKTKRIRKYLDFPEEDRVQLEKDEYPMDLMDLAKGKSVSVEICTEWESDIDPEQFYDVVLYRKLQEPITIELVHGKYLLNEPLCKSKKKK